MRYFIWNKEKKKLAKDLEPKFWDQKFLLSSLFSLELSKVNTHPPQDTNVI